MLSINNWSKEKVHDVMLELLYSFNFMWFQMADWIKSNCQEELANEGLLYFAEEFGSYEAKRLDKIIKDKKHCIYQLIQFLEHSHWYAFENIKTSKLSDTEFCMITFECTSQKAAKRWGMDYYDCSSIALKLRSSFFTWINPNAKVTPILLPPEKEATEGKCKKSCEWNISIE